MISAVLHYASKQRTIHISETTTYIELLNVHLADVYNPSLSFTDEEGEKVRFNSPVGRKENQTITLR
jgi:SET domain-containing protein